MLKLAFSVFSFIVLSLPAIAQTAAIPVTDCTLSGTKATVSGMKSTNYQMGIIPSCTVTVYLTGTQTLATTSPQSPFTANADGSIPPIYATVNQGYDVVLSGGVAPNTYPSPKTITGLYPGTNIENGCGTGSPCTISQGGTGSSTAAGARATLGIIGPTFNIMDPQYGATSSTCNGSTDDTAVIQAAFNACAGNVGGILTNIWGGTVQFPGGLKSCHTSSTINAYDGCKISGGSDANKPSIITYTGSAASGTCSITGFTLAANSTPLYTAAFPQVPGSIQNRTTSNIITATCSNSFTPGQWVYLDTFSSLVGLEINRSIAQIATANASGFTALIPVAPSYGTYVDSGTATVVNVMLAFDANARYQQEVKNIVFNGADIGVFYGSRVDTGSNNINVQAENDKIGWYYSSGGINIKFDNGWRADNFTMAAIYWRVGGGDNFALNNGTTSTTVGAGGAAVIADNAGCVSNSVLHVSVKDTKTEVNATPTYAGGIYTLLDCALYYSPQPQFFFDLDTVWGGGFGMPNISVIPANDYALELNVTNSTFSSVAGVPALTRSLMTGSSGFTPHMAYSPPFTSSGVMASSVSSAIQGLGDTNTSQTYHYTVRSSDYLYSDTAFAALPNGTTLYAGQILAPPSYWNGANGKRYAIDAVYQTGTTGTPNSGSTTCTTPNFTITRVSGSGGVVTLTGSFNVSAFPELAALAFITDSVLGLTNSRQLILTASATKITFSGAYTGSASDTGNVVFTPYLTCSSGTDLSPGQVVSISSQTGTINAIDASITNAVVLKFNSYFTAVTGAALGYTAPVLGLEIQMPTKTAAVPTTLAWSQGDIEQNSGATANGIAAWVNVVAGTPGTWAAIPLGSSSGVLAPAQIGTGTPGAGKYVDGATGAWTTIPSGSGIPTNTPAWLQYLGSGADGSYEISPTGSCTTSPNHCFIGSSGTPYAFSGDSLMSALTIDSGAYVSVNAFNGGAQFHVTGACVLNGTIIANGSKNTWASSGIGGGPGGGGGGGTAAGLVGTKAYPNASLTGLISNGGGTAGALTGGSAGSASVWGTQFMRGMVNTGFGVDGVFLTGAAGGTGGSTGGAGGQPGSGIIFSCGSLDGTGGVIDASGYPGTPAAANSTGSGGGGGGGVVILSSQATVSTWPTIYVAGGPGALSTVPEALGVGGSCTTQPKATLTLTTGSLSGCVVAQAGAGCGTGTGITWSIVGGGGTGGTVTPTWSGGAMASCTASGGSGYTATTYTTSGNGGDGAAGWYSEFQGW